jgi:serine/threonine protein kinase
MDDDAKTPPALPLPELLPLTSVRTAPSGPRSELSAVGPPSGSAILTKPAPLKLDYLTPGMVVNGWVIHSKVGSGGMGAVYQVHEADAAPPGTSALKLSIPPADESAVDCVARTIRCEREFASVLLLDHPNIVKPFSFFRWPSATSGHPCIVMPFVQGEQINKHCRLVQPTLRVILESLLVPMAEALDYIHRKGLFHRDIKPPNIMVRSADGVPLLMDFGIARATAGSTLTSTELLTTYEYGAPEYLGYFSSSARSLKNTFVYEAASDLFCLGGAFFDVLTGHLPYQHVVGVDAPGSYLGETFQSALRKYEPASAMEHNAAVPAEVDALLLRLMARSPSERFESGYDLAEAVRALLERLPAPHPQLDVPFVPPDRVRGVKPLKTTAGRRKPTTKPPAPPEAAAGSVRAPSVVAPSGPGAFRAPTAAAAKQAFASPLEAAPEHQAPADADEVMPTGIRQAQARLRASTPSTSSHQRLLVGGLGLLVLVLIVAVVAAGSTGKPAAPQPQSLLDEKEAAAPSSPPPTPVLLVPQPELLPATEIDGGFEALQPPAVVAKRSVKRGANPDAAAIDAMLKAEYGGERPLAGGTPPKPIKKPSWVQGADDDEAAAAPQTTALGIPTGTEITVRLTKPLDSRTVGAGPAVARLMRPLVVRGAVSLPSGTMVYGSASSMGTGRFDLRLTRLKLPDGREVEFAGIAYDMEDKKPGLRASSRIQGATAKDTGLGEKLVKGTANTLLGKVGGSDVGDLAQGAGQTVLGQDSRGQAQGAGDALLLEAPVDFTVFVAGAF